MTTNEILFAARLLDHGLHVTFPPSKSKPIHVWTSLGETSCKMNIPRPEIAAALFPERMADDLAVEVAKLYRAEGLTWPPV